MFLRRHPRIRTALLAFACALWVFGSVAGQLHDVLYTHVVCAEHGVVEHGIEAGAVEADSQAGPSIGAAESGEHGEVCTDPGVPSAPPTVPLALTHPAAATVGVADAPLTGAATPRGPPLAYAPKTSPPARA